LPVFPMSRSRGKAGLILMATRPLLDG